MSEIKINFDELIRNYQKNLLVKLRGFGEVDFLKYWVPGLDDKSSLINLIDALVENNNLNFEIEFDNYLYDVNNLNEIINNYNDKIGKVNLIVDNPEKKIFAFKINFEKYKNFYQNEINKVKIKKTSVLNYFPVVNNLNKIIIDYDIHPDYRKNIENKKINKLKNFRNDLGFKNFLQLEIYNYKIFLQVENNIVVEAYHNISDVNYVSIVIDHFVGYIINLPFQEVAEHSIIYVENFFRPVDFNKTIKGIILPHFGGRIFQKLSDSIIDLFRTYQLNNGLKKIINKYYSDVSADWKNIPYIDKVKIIDKVIDQCVKIFLLNRDEIKYNSLELDFRIILDISDSFKEKLQSRNYLIEIEDMLKNKIDNRLELFIIEIQDENKLRHKNSPLKIT
jgi:hypothetical protein